MNRFFKKMTFFIGGALIFQEKFCPSKKLFFQYLTSSISQLSYALSILNKIFKIGSSNLKRGFRKSGGHIYEIWGKKPPPFCLRYKLNIAQSKSKHLERDVDFMKQQQQMCENSIQNLASEKEELNINYFDLKQNLSNLQRENKGLQNSIHLLLEENVQQQQKVIVRANGNENYINLRICYKLVTEIYVFFYSKL